VHYPARPRAPVLPLGLAVATLGLAALVGLGPGPLDLENLPLLTGAVAGLLLALVWPGLGLGLLPTAAAAVPFSLGTGTGSPLVAGLLFAMLLLAGWLVRALALRRSSLRASPLNAPLLTLVLVWLLAFVAANVVRTPLVMIWSNFTLVELASLAIVAASVGVLLLAAQVDWDSPGPRLAVWSFLLLGAVLLGLRLFGLDQSVRFVSVSGLIPTWFVALAAGQALFNARLAGPLRLALAALAALWLIQLGRQAFWLSGWMPALAALAVIAFLRSRRLFLLLGLAGLAVIVSNPDRFYRAIWLANLDEGSGNRLEIWGQAWDLLSQYPLFGTGPAGYTLYYQSVYAGSGFSMSSHSNYVDVAAQTGLIGLAAFCWLVGTLLLVGRRACQRADDGFARGYAHGALGGLVGVLVAMTLGDWFIPFVYNQTIAGFRYTVQSWVFLGLLAGLAVQPRGEAPS
jgi:hypothetical protein